LALGVARLKVKPEGVSQCRGQEEAVRRKKTRGLVTGWGSCDVLKCHMISLSIDILHLIWIYKQKLTDVTNVIKDLPKLHRLNLSTRMRIPIQAGNFSV
jgi:hypothetical protein